MSKQFNPQADISKAGDRLTDAHYEAAKVQCPGDRHAQNAIKALGRVIEHAESAQEQLE